MKLDKEDGASRLWSVESRGVGLGKGDHHAGGGEKRSPKFGELPTLARGMFVQRRQFNLAPGDIVKDN